MISGPLMIGRAPGATAAALALLTLLASAPTAFAQRATRLAVLQAEDRRAPSAQDLATLRSGARSGDPQTAQIALRALGRLERPALIADILPGLRHALPEVRVEAANAVAQAAQGLRVSGASGATSASALATAQQGLTSRLSVEADPDVRAALSESIARLPYTSAADIARAESTLVELASRAQTNSDRLGVARGLEALTRLHRDTRPPSPEAVAALVALARTEGRPEQEWMREARVRRLALESLIAIGAADRDLVTSAAADPDAQVRRLAMRAASHGAADDVLSKGVEDPSSLVRIEALRALRAHAGPQSCSSSLRAASDEDMNVALVAIDQLGVCGASDDALRYLGQIVSDVADAEAPRNWHRAAHAIVALAAAAPDRAAAAMPALAASRVWQLRSYTARAAATLKDRETLEALARDSSDNVVETAIAGLRAIAGHDADAVYAAALSRSSYAVLRGAALALDGTSRPAAVDALRAALARVDDDPKPGAIDARTALRKALATAGVAVGTPRKSAQPSAPLNDQNLRRLAAPRARFTIRDVGVFDVALFTMQAPATVLRFAELAASGYYDGLTFHRVVPNGVIQGGSPGANEYSSDAPLMRDEVGLWPHVRGALGISTRGRDTGDAQIFIDLVDNPRYDHTYTVFAQVLNGLEVVDQILEGDVIERVDILP